LQQLWTADNLNQEAIDAKTKEMNSIRVQMLQKSREMLNKIKTVLTPEQIKKLESLKQKRLQERPGPGMPGGCNGNGTGI
jgi:Spy/CpxP family protein refolding chaperone